MPPNDKNGLYRAQYEAIKTDPEKSQIIEDLESEIGDMQDEIGDLKNEITKLERIVEEKDEQIRLMLDSFEEIEDQASRCQKAYK